MSASNGDNGGPTNNQGTERPIYDTIDFEFDNGADGPIAANDTIRGSDWSTIEGDNSLASNEVAEVFKVEMIPPHASDGSLQTISELRLWDGENYYPNVRWREFMLGFFGPNYQLSSVPLGTPVLSGEVNPNQNPIDTATPKFGTSTDISPALINDGTQTSDDITVRLHVWRWKGDDNELQNWFSTVYGQTTFNQNIRMTNPFTGSSRTYNRQDPVRITPGADGGALGQFTKLTGGVDQELPKVFPWVTWSENNSSTRANNYYEFTTRNDRVDESWKRLEFDFTDQKEAVFFDHLQVNAADDLYQGQLAVNERDEDPEVWLSPTSQHELPVVRPLDGTTRELHSGGDLPVALADRFGGRQVIWDDGGGFRVKDNGTQISSNNILVGVNGRRLELTS